MTGLNAVPSNYYSDSLKELGLTTPPECVDQDYCTIKPNDYPEEVFNKLFKDYIYPYPDMVLPDPDLDVYSRSGSLEEEDMCLSKVSYEPIYTAVAEDRKNYLVIQAPEVNYHQSIRLEKCTNPGASCFDLFPGAADITTSCVQGYTTWSLLASDGHGSLVHINATLPTCCSCKVIVF